MTDTKTRILDSAEKLFAKNGFDAVSLRAITARARVNLAAVNYHFRSKDALIEAAIARRIQPINRQRLEMLEACGPNPTVEQIVEAFIAPVFEGHGLDPIRPLIGRLLASPHLFLERFFKRHLTEVAQRFTGALARAVPDLPPVERQWRLHFLAGIMAHILAWADILPLMSGGLCDPSDPKAVTRRIVAFVAAGLRAPAPADAAEV